MSQQEKRSYLQESLQEVIDEHVEDGLSKKGVVEVLEDLADQFKPDKPEEPKRMYDIRIECLSNPNGRVRRIEGNFTKSELMAKVEEEIRKA